MRDVLEISKAGSDLHVDGKKLTKSEKEKLIREYTKQMREASRMLEFEYAALMRDKIAELEKTK